MSNFKIRLFEPADASPVADLSIRAWEPVFASFETVLGRRLFLRFYPDWRTQQKAAVREALNANDTWVSTAGEGVAGFVNVIFDAHEAAGEIYMIAVDPSYQRNGIALQLTQFAVSEMRSRGLTLATVATGADPGHEAARRTYEGAGFTALPQVLYSKLV